MSDIAIPIPKGYKLIVIVSDESCMKDIDDFKKILKEFNQSNACSLIVKEGFIKQIYLVDKLELKEE